ncbi:protein-tyrosine sulfotransferase [Lepeophtheirus salmonis]|nr:protein-tyrosine sulfotransferase-like [Lepeophtheirus salmonis]
MPTRINRKPLIGICLFFVLIYFIFIKWKNPGNLCPFQVSRKTSVISEEGSLYEYDRKSPIIFIGGVPRSGTTLMRAMLDAHPSVRCGEETRVVPRILQMRSHWMKSQKESTRLEEAGLTGEVLDQAISSFILEIVARHGEPSERLCNKDPFTLRSGVYLRKLFPNSKFIFMVRDGRATVHSIITRQVTITGFDLKSYRQSLQKWNSAISAMNTQCDEIGPEFCLIVKYEQLVLHPRPMMTKILKFLDLDWTEDVLHHEKQINKPHGISLSKVERSSDQVVKPVNLEALSKWVNKMPDDVVQDMAEIAPMLQHFGYDPNSNPPSYGKPDSDVVENTNEIKKNANKWDEQGKLVKKISKKLSDQN